MKSSSFLPRTLPLYGCFFFLAITASFSCQKKQSVDVSSSLPTIAQAAIETPSTTASTSDGESKASATTTPTADSSATVALRFTAYNVANWLTMEERFDFATKKTTKNASKPDDEKQAALDILIATKPDVVGLSEIGTKEDLAEIQRMLKDKGLDLAVSHFAQGGDTSRRLGLLSKFPISSTAQPEKLDYVISGKTYSMQRGILDATINTPDGRPWRFLGVHLKSKREVDNGDQNLMRINEAQLLRRHIEGILKQDPQARLICYGDFNDTRRTSPMRIAQGSYNSANYMTPIALHDSRNEYWTHYWEREDVYARIDYIHYSPALKGEVLFHECGIVDLPSWRKASDHRAIKAAFR
jgi:endonuclease/exonuclease/phosphatase family metal-dependent hydrolase